MEATRSYETSILTRSRRRHIPEDGILPDYMTSPWERQRFICMWRRTRPYVSVSPSALHISCGRNIWRHRDGLDKVEQTIRTYEPTPKRMGKQITLETWHDALNEAEHTRTQTSQLLRVTSHFPVGLYPWGTEFSLNVCNPQHRNREQ
jgi:hypothetical protein